VDLDRERDGADEEPSEKSTAGSGAKSAYVRETLSCAARTAGSATAKASSQGTRARATT
jgi:hypothetical protein